MKLSKTSEGGLWHKTGVMGTTFDLGAAGPCHTVGPQQHLLLLF